MPPALFRGAPPRLDAIAPPANLLPAMAALELTSPFTIARYVTVFPDKSTLLFNFPVVTAPSKSFTSVTAPFASSSVVTVELAISLLTTSPSIIASEFIFLKLL